MTVLLILDYLAAVRVECIRSFRVSEDLHGPFRVNTLRIDCQLKLQVPRHARSLVDDLRGNPSTINVHVSFTGGLLRKK